MASDDEFDLPGAETYFEGTPETKLVWGEDDDEYDLPNAEAYLEAAAPATAVSISSDDAFDFPDADDYFDSPLQPVSKKRKEASDLNLTTPLAKKQKVNQHEIPIELSPTAATPRPPSASQKQSASTVSNPVAAIVEEPKISPEQDRLRNEKTASAPLKTVEKLPKTTQAAPRPAPTRRNLPPWRNVPWVPPQGEPDEVSKAHECLAIPELLERIILQLEPTEIFAVQRVCARFRDIVVRSIPLRRKMYFVPEKYFVRVELNQLLGMKSTSNLSKAIHPFRVQLYADRDGPGISVTLKNGYPNKGNVDHLIKDFKDKSRPAIASWRRILICQTRTPLQMEVSAYHKSRVQNPPRKFKPKYPLKGEVTLGKVIDLARSLAVQVCWDKKKEWSSWRSDSGLAYGEFDHNGMWDGPILWGPLLPPDY